MKIVVANQDKLKLKWNELYTHYAHTCQAGLDCAKFVPFDPKTKKNVFNQSDDF